MINFQHTCFSNQSEAIDLAKKIRFKSTITSNPLIFLLNKRLNTKLLTSTYLDTITDFPKLTEDDIKNNIFFGSFQLKQSKSYVIDLISNGKAYEVTKELLKQFSNHELKAELMEKKSKIIAVEIASRHKRSETKIISKAKKNTKLGDADVMMKKFKISYKVYVQYIPNKNEASSIKGNKCIELIITCSYNLYIVLVNQSICMQLYFRSQNCGSMCSCCNAHLLS